MSKTKELREELNELLKSADETILTDESVIRRSLEIEQLLSIRMAHKAI